MTRNKLVEDPEMLYVCLRRNIHGKVTLCTGVFDVLHFGHVQLLEYAASINTETSRFNMLVVGINSDAAVRELKGPTRPIHNEEARARVIAALECVDEVCIINDIRVTNSLRIINPDVWVKGGQYTLETLDKEEREQAEKQGTKIVFAPHIEGYSTTEILKKL